MFMISSVILYYTYIYIYINISIYMCTTFIGMKVINGVQGLIHMFFLKSSQSLITRKIRKIYLKSFFDCYTLSTEFIIWRKSSWMSTFCCFVGWVLFLEGRNLFHKGKTISIWNCYMFVSWTKNDFFS